MAENEGRQPSHTERVRLATLLAAAIVASDAGDWDHAAVAENAWDLLQAIEAEGNRRLKGNANGR